MVLKNINDKEIEIYHQLRDNSFREDNSFIADSPKVVNILLQTDIEIKSILATKEYYEEYKELLKRKKIPIAYVATKKEMQNIVGHKIHHNCMMHGIRPSQTMLKNLDKHIVMVDALTSTQNIGSIARSAAALGIYSFLLPKTAPHPYSRRALRVSMGHISKLKYHIYDDLALTIKALQKDGYKVYAAEVSQKAINLQNINLSHKWVLLMGSEGNGLSSDIIDMCDHCVSIEMGSDVRSFNVSIAASILMYNFLHK